MPSDPTGAETNSSLSEQTPVTAHSLQELANMLRQWMQDHPGEKPPGLLRLNRSHLSNPPTQAVMTSTSERVQVSRYQLTTDHMAWCLLLRSGSYMLVSPCNGSWGGYVAWLGANLGFTSNAIARKINARPTKPLDGYVANKEQSKEPLPPHRRRHDVQTPSHPNVYLQRERRVLPPFQPRPEPERESSPTRHPEPGLPSMHNPSRSRRPLEIQRTVEPVSSPIMRHGESLIPEVLDQAPLEIQPNVEPESSPIMRHERSLIPEVLDQTPLEIQRPVEPESFPIMKRESSSSVQELERLPTPSLVSSKRRKTEQTSRIPLSPTTFCGTQTASSQYSIPPRTLGMPTPTPSSWSEPASRGEVVFQFLLADETHGAVTKFLRQCNTMTSFFDSASAAWRALGTAQKADMAVVTVSVPGASRPLVVPWRDKELFETMMEVVMRASRTVESLEVEVRCKQAG